MLQSLSKEMNTTHKKRIFSGVQASGKLTLGNYLGAIRNFVQLQEKGHDCIYCIVDLHAITVWQNPATLAEQTREVTAGFLAAGIDPRTTIVFNQSRVSAHAELAWIFNCVSRLGWLNRMTQFKDKAGKNREKASTGLYVYPNLMAADILVYLATHVPVGDDQKQHLELTRDIAQKFNNDFQVDLFPLVEPLISGHTPRVMSLRDGTQKMSKSDPSDFSRINLMDDPDTISKKIRKAKTDTGDLPDAGVLKETNNVHDGDGERQDFTTEFRATRPEAANLLKIHATLSGSSLDKTVEHFSGKGFSVLKTELAELAINELEPLGREMKRLLSQPDEIDSVLQKGAERARERAQPVLKQVHRAIGFLGSRTS